MTSEIRVNKLHNRVGLGTVEYTNTGIVVSGIVTCTELSGLTALNIAGVGTAHTLDINGDIDVDGHTNLDNVSIVGVTTITGTSPTINFEESDGNPNYRIIGEGGALYFQALPYGAGASGRLTLHSAGNVQVNNNLDVGAGIDVTGNATVSGDIDVDGHTNLDNVSIAGVTTTTDHIYIDADNKKLNIGDGSDLQLYHTGSRSEIINNTGDLIIQPGASSNLFLRSQTGAAHFKGVHAAQVELYWNGNKRLETSSVGVSITKDLDVDGHTNLDNVSIAGIVTASNATISGNQILGHGNSTGNQIKFTRSGLGDELVIGTDGYGNSTQYEATIQSSIVTARPLVFATNNTERLRILGNGNITFGVQNAVTAVTSSTIKYISGGRDYWNGTKGDYRALRLRVYDNGGNIDDQYGMGVSNGQLEIQSQGTIGLYASGAGSSTGRRVHAMTIDTGQKLLLGLTSARTNFFNAAATHVPRFQIESTNNDIGRAAIGLVYGKTNDSGPYITLAKHRSNTVGANTVVQQNDETGIISFQGSDGSEFLESARIQAFIDGTPGSNNMPGRLVFRTTPSGSAATVERVRIDNSGKVAMNYDAGLVNAQYGNLEILKDGASNVDPNWSYLSFHRTGQIAWQQGINANSFVIASTGGAARDTLENEKLRISSNGDVRIGSGTPATFGTGTTVLETYNASTYTANLVTSGTHQLQMIASQTHGAASIGTRSNHNLNLCVNDSTKVTVNTEGEVRIATRNSANGGELGFRFGAFGIRTQDVNGYNWWRIDRNYGGWKSDMISLRGDGHVGINTDNPSKLLTIQGGDLAVNEGRLYLSSDRDAAVPGASFGYQVISGYKEFSGSNTYVGLAYVGHSHSIMIQYMCVEGGNTALGGSHGEIYFHTTYGNSQNGVAQQAHTVAMNGGRITSGVSFQYCNSGCGSHGNNYVLRAKVSYSGSTHNFALHYTIKGVSAGNMYV